MNATTLFLFITRAVQLNSTWTKSLTTICQDYFDPYLTAVFTDGTILLTDKIFQTLGPVIIYDVNNSAPEAQQKFTKSRNVLIFQTSPKTSINLNQYFFFNAHGRILITTPDSPKEWLDNLWTRTQAINAVVLTMDTLKLHTWFPYTADDCRTVGSITELSEDVFPEKLGSNLNNCDLRIVSAEIYPFNVDETDGNFQNGVETNIIKTFASKYNLTRTLIKTEPEFYWAGIVPGYGPMGALRFMYENLGDFAIAGIALNYDFLQYADASLPFFEDSLSWFVPIPNFIPSVEKIPRTISGNYRVYLSITIVLITTVSGLLAHCKGTSKMDTVFNSIRAYIFSPVIMPRNRILRLLIMFTYFFSMHVTIAFQAALIYLLANDVSEVPITDITQALDRNMKFYFYDYHRHLINQSGTGSFLTNTIMQKHLYNFDQSPDYSAFAFNKTGVFLGPKESTAFYLKSYFKVIDQYGRSILTPLKEAFSSYLNVLLAVKGHPLLPLFERTCQQLNEAGIINWWMVRIASEGTVSVTKENVPLSIEDLIGAFILLGIFLLFSLITFVLELLMNKFFKWRGKGLRKKRAVNFLK